MIVCLSQFFVIESILRGLKTSVKLIWIALRILLYIVSIQVLDCYFLRLLIRAGHSLVERVMKLLRDRNLLFLILQYATNIVGEQLLLNQHL